MRDGGGYIFQVNIIIINIVCVWCIIAESKEIMERLKTVLRQAGKKVRE